jgi:hypothetical protein
MTADEFRIHLKYAQRRYRVRAYGMAWLTTVNAACLLRSADDLPLLACFLFATVGFAFMTGYWVSIAVYFHGMMGGVK